MHKKIINLNEAPTLTPKLYFMIFRKEKRKGLFQAWILSVPFIVLALHLEIIFIQTRSS